jgi:cytochrome c553
MMFAMLMGAGSVLAGGDAARGAELTTQCVDCHGEGGLGDEDFPRLAGLEEELHFKLLKGFGSDEESEMREYVADLSEQDMADIAAYYATLPGE